MNRNSQGLKLSDILVTVLVAVLFAVAYNFVWLPYEAMKPLGLHFEQLIYGVWFMAAVVAYLIVPKAGIALLAEFAAGAGETIVMGKFDIPTFVFAFLQGLACEFVFMLFKYQSRSMMVCILAGVAAAIISLPVEYFYGYMSEVAGWNVLLYIIMRLISGALVTGVLSYLIVKALDQTGVTKLFRTSTQSDYDSL
ncbi:thiamine ABC transporter permease [Macrococcus epidermidis]|uniref:Thiamine ABC transporter permease n=1 Tax=Macrococcus epidermidis TaxID=1902580 RepID=A0A327ZUN3_9STAP|nr:ECF transporter S component [Macrococcus epidermidis]RAK44708.1 thiamine ABC transporter permease [Macrococcus epidermidis]